MREIENITRIEGKVFAAPKAAVSSSKMGGTKPTVIISQAAIEAAGRSVETFYPTRSQEIAMCALVAAMPYLMTETQNVDPRGNDVNVSDEAIETAAEAIYSSCGPVQPWDSVGYRLRLNFRDDARVLLQAAVPYLTPNLRSVFWDDLAEDLKDPEFAEQFAQTTAEIQKQQNG